MSHGSWFLILRSNKSYVTAEQIDQFFKKNKNILNDSLFKKTKTLDDICDYFSLDYQNHLYVNVKNRKLYSELLNVHFNSQFNQLKQFYNMNPYNKYCQLVLSYSQAKRMLQTINYIRLRKYDKDFQRILDSEYLNMFEDLDPIFEYRFSTIDKQYKDSGQYTYQCQLAENIFNRLFNVLNTYITMVNQKPSNDQFILVYNAY